LGFVDFSEHRPLTFAFITLILGSVAFRLAKFTLNLPCSDSEKTAKLIRLAGMQLQTRAYLFWQKEFSINQQHAKLFIHLHTTSQPAVK